MARRDLRQEQIEEDNPKRGLLWVIFCMPGALVLWMQYKFPTKGDVLASARRYGDPGVEFLYTMMIYAVLGAAVYFLPRTEMNPSRPNEAAQMIANGATNADDEVTEALPPNDVITEQVEAPQPEPASDEVPYAPPDAEEIAASLPEDPPF